MTIAALKSIASGATPLPTKPVNVRRGDEPMVRTLRAVELVRRDGELWLYWRWTPANQTPEGRMDCGYSGTRLEGRAA